LPDGQVKLPSSCRAVDFLFNEIVDNLIPD